MLRITFDEMQLLAIKKMYNAESKSAEEISKVFRCSKPTILKTLRNQGVDTSPKIKLNSFSEQSKKDICNLYMKDKLSMAEIGKRYNISRTPIKKILNSMAISLRENGPQIGKPNPKCSETRKRLFAEGKIIHHQPMKGKHHSEETKLKLRLLGLGEGNHFYGKRHSLQNRIKMSALKKEIPLESWKSFKKNEKYDFNWSMGFKNQIRQRDNQVCMNCGIHRERLNEALHIHHINYDKQCTIEPNCLALCRNCHMLTNANRAYWTQLFQEKLSKLYGYKYQDGKIILELKQEISKNVEL